MSEILERTWSFLTSSGAAPKWSVPSNQATATSHLPHGHAQFIKSVIQAPTAQTEAELVNCQLQAIRSKLQEPNLKTSVLADCVVRAMLCSMLGYSVDFASIYALQLAQKGTITEKKLGYLACVVFLNVDSDLILLLINTILRDLKSANILENNMALVTAAYLVPKEMSAMLVPVLVEKVSHSKDFIRKKALICLEQIATKNPDMINPALEAASLALSDKDPGVALIAIQVINALFTQYPSLNVTCIEGICDVQRQILDGKLPKEFEFHLSPAPWAQMSILRLLRSLNDKIDNRETVIDLIIDTVEQPFPGEHTIGQAVIFECIETLAMILRPEVDSQYNKIMRRMMRYLNSLLKSENGNNVYVGLCAFQSLLTHQEAGIVPYVSDTERDFVFRSLDHEDNSIQRKAFSLLDALATQENVKDVCEKIISHVKLNSDDYYRGLLIQRAMQIVDKFPAVSLDWRAFLLLRLLQCTRDQFQRQQIMDKMQKLFGDKPYSEETLAVGKKLLDILKTPAQEENAPDTLLVFYLWSLTNFCQNSRLPEIMSVVKRSHFKEFIVSKALNSIFTIITEDEKLAEPEELGNFLHQCAETTDLNDQIDELKMIIKLVPHLKDNLQANGSEDFYHDCTMSFLDQVVIEAIQEGGAIYDPNLLKVPVVENQRSRSPSLRFTPYNTMDESEWRSMISSPKSDIKSTTSSNSSKNIVWTAQGRVKEEDQISTSKNDETKDELEASVIQDLKEWAS